MSADLQWAVLRNNNSFLLKKNGVTFSTEPNNLTNKHSFKANGLVNKRTVGVTAAPGGRGVVVALRKDRNAFKPAKAVRQVTLKKNSRHTLKAIQSLTSAQHYREDLTAVSVVQYIYRERL